MCLAAQAGDWTSLAALERQCASHQQAVQAGVPPLTGEARSRKIALLKQIMANDRAIRDVTESWINHAIPGVVH